MANINLNLDNIASSRVHTPRIDKLPIYARVDGEMECGSGANTVRSDKWLNAVKRTFTSPDNIRRAFITHKGIITHLYKPIYGSSNNALESIKLISEDLQSVYNSIIQRTMGAKEQYKVTGTGISAIAKPWVCSNIEEIYFDWTMFMSMDVRNMGLGDLLFEVGPITGKTLDITQLKQIFNTACMRGVKDIQARYPRLKAVGYMENLFEIYQNEPKKTDMRALEDIKIPWCLNQSVKAAISGGKATIWKIEGVPELNTARSLRPGIYTYDRDILESFFDNLEARVKAYNKNERDKQIDSSRKEIEQQMNQTKGTFEVMLDKIYDTSGISGVASATKISLRHSSKAERVDMYNTLTSDGKLRYKEILGVD